MTVALITGATRGIGYETARQLRAEGYEVYLGARDLERGERAAAAIGARPLRLDVTDDASVIDALASIDAAHGRLDLLVNNAGVQEFGVADGPTALRTFDTNAVGVLRVTEAALPLLGRSANPLVITVSSSAGSFWAVTDPERPEFGLTNAIYSASKAAATMLTVHYAKANPRITFTAVEPGYTATDMTADFEGGRSAAESAGFIVRVATRSAGGPSGTLQDEAGPLRW